MPHLRIEVSPALHRALDWAALLPALHQGLAGPGWAALDDLKTRVLVLGQELAGDDAQGQQLVATLITTNPRPPEVLQAMQQAVLAGLHAAVARAAPPNWVQCCVFLQPMARADYAKQQWPPDAAAPAAVPPLSSIP